MLHQHGNLYGSIYCGYWSVTRQAELCYGVSNKLNVSSDVYLITTVRNHAVLVGAVTP